MENFLAKTYALLVVLEQCKGEFNPERSYVDDLENDLLKAIDIVCNLRNSVSQVGSAFAMPGTSGGFTTQAFKADDVPVGTPLYTIKG